MQVGQVHPGQRAAEGDQVGVGAGAGHFHAPGAAERRVQCVGHCGGVGADLDAGGRVGLGVVGELERETAPGCGVDLDLLHLGLRGAVGQRGVGVAGAGGGLAAQVELEARGRDGAAGEFIDKAHHVAVARAAVGGVEFHLHGAGPDLTAGQVLEQRGVGRAHLRDRGGHVAVAAVERAHGLGRVRHQEDVVFLGDLLGLEDDGQRGRCARAAGLHLGHGGAARGCGGLRVALQRQALHLAGAGGARRLLLHQPVADQVHRVGACGARVGEGDDVGLVHAAFAVLQRAHRDADRYGLFAQRLQHHLLALVHAGLCGLCRLHLVGGGCALGAGGDVGHVHARQRANELHHVAVHAVAADAHVVCAHALQALQARLELVQHLCFGVGAADLHVRAAGVVARAGGAAELQRAHEVVRELKLQLGVDLDRLLGLGGQGDALVQVDQHLLGLHGQAGDAAEGGAAGAGLQAGEAACGVLGVADQCQAEVHLSQAQAHRVGGARVDASKGVDAAAADGDDLGVLDGRAVGQHHVLVALLDPKAALHREEAEQVHVQVTRGLGDLALRALQAQVQRAALRVGGHGQRGGARGVVHHLVAVLARLVDGHAQAGGRHRQPIDALEGHLAGGGLQAGPAARGVGAVAQQCQCELHLTHRQADALALLAADAHEAAEVAAADGQQVGLHGALVGQLQRLRGLLQRQEALDLHKAQHVQRQVTAGARELAQAAVAVQRDGAVRAAGHLVLPEPMVQHGVGLPARARHAAVDLHAQIAGAGGEAFQAHHADAAGRGLEGGEVARRVGAALFELLAGQQQAKVHVGQRQALRIGRAAVQPRKRLHAAAADGQHARLDLGGCLGLGRSVRSRFNG